MVLLRILIYVSTLITVHLDPIYALTSQQIKEICKKEVNYVKCMNNSKALRKNTARNKEKKLFIPIPIEVIPYKDSN